MALTLFLTAEEVDFGISQVLAKGFNFVFLVAIYLAALSVFTVLKIVKE